MVQRPYYSKKVIERFMHPRNLGVIKDADGVGKVGNMKCGDLMELFIKVEKKKNKEVIKDIKFRTLGCAAAISTSDMICDLAKGKTFKEALKVGFQDIADKLGNMPPQKIHCCVLAQQGLKAAIEDYEKKKKSKK
ncbi:MAG TPA: iron-sulfur cluster assembly scaffold protein [Candidatus Parcubacteria bacterium]|jgi:nitrogen fixation NifU-like protein|nr:iron-sulfur cluster assembly scaffold protein [Parcubacteria group bacterium]HJN62093.1 iron-sulfur cluster assembly scaffold protein [Candidatus Parcubacteria bacterium]|tara:strand:- start:459 stop:863 length:405 start_codon:yes stop_codon:yes gene_type:complete